VSDPKLMAVVARALAELMAGLTYDRIAAIPYGGLPLGQAVALATSRVTAGVCWNHGQAKAR